MKRLLLLSFLVVAFAASAQQPAKRELRGAWIATVANIDWPTQPGLSEEQQKNEMIELLDEFKSYNMNTVVFQIRPTADAFYRSTKEPATHWITGIQGVAPSYDPLQFVIDECDKRGMNVHVWLNPYRVEMDVTRNQHIAADHLLKTHPEYFVVYGKTRYFNPGLDETREFVSSVVGEIVRDYDIDAIHMDDYFYPYKIAGEEFPDEDAFRKNPRGFTDKEDWRRNNVDLIIKQIRDTIVANKPWVEFGISPFGVWRNKAKDPTGSDTRAGVTNYDDLYADILKWQKEGWIDYVVPQLYWNIGFEVADFEKLAYWWAQNHYGAKIYVGQATYLINKDSKNDQWRSEDQIVRQAHMIQAIPNLDGAVHFSGKSMYTEDKRKENYGRTALKEKLLTGAYQTKSIAPVANRVVEILPGKPTDAVLTRNGNKTQLLWNMGEDNRRFVVYRFPKDGPRNYDDPAFIYEITGLNYLDIDEPYTGDYAYTVTALSPTQHESQAAEFVIW